MKSAQEKSSSSSLNFYISPLLPYGKGYKIIFEGVPTDWEKLPLQVQEQIGSLYEKIVSDPKQALAQLKDLSATYPHVHVIANLHVFALLRLKKRKESELLIEKMAKDFPDSLASKVNLADLRIRQKKLNTIPEIFEHRFDLNTLYPEREEFYYSEFRGFCIVMGLYHLHIKDLRKAEQYYEMAFLVDPLHFTVVSLEKSIKKSHSYLQKLARFFKKS